MKIINTHTLTELVEFMLDGEPVFIIRAQDKLAPAVIREYIDMAKHENAGNTIRCEGVLARFCNWQTINRRRVKIPD